jgi:hypothetical protein
MKSCQQIKRLKDKKKKKIAVAGSAGDDVLPYRH